MKDRIVAFLLFLGKIAITAVVGVLAYLGFGSYLDLGTQLWGRALNYYLLPVMVSPSHVTFHTVFDPGALELTFVLIDR